MAEALARAASLLGQMRSLSIGGAGDPGEVRALRSQVDALAGELRDGDPTRFRLSAADLVLRALDARVDSGTASDRLEDLAAQIQARRQAFEREHTLESAREALEPVAAELAHGAGAGLLAPEAPAPERALELLTPPQADAPGS